MKILHTSDWHIGRTLYGRNRQEEFEKALEWLLEVIEEQQVELLVVAGDIFDNGTPSNQAQKLYYRFLCRAATSRWCKNLLIVAGNHDSPSFLSAPQELLRALNVYVVGAKSEQLEEQLLLLSNREGEPELIVCAVPYLRDRDTRSVELGESSEEKGRKLAEGIASHYRELTDRALALRAKLGKPLPILATGHLFTAGALRAEDDGVRELYVGSLLSLPASLFPREIDYLALGHLHLPQKVGGSEHLRYSGSLLPIGFGELATPKKVLLVELSSNQLQIEELPVPRFQKMASLSGNLEELKKQLLELEEQGEQVLVEINYEGEELTCNLRQELQELLTRDLVEILRLKNRRRRELTVKATAEQSSLEEFEPLEVFEQCLESYQIVEEERAQLRESYQLLLEELWEKRRNRL